MIEWLIDLFIWLIRPLRNIGWDFNSLITIFCYLISIHAFYFVHIKLTKTIRELFEKALIKYKITYKKTLLRSIFTVVGLVSTLSILVVTVDQFTFWRKALHVHKLYNESNAMTWTITEGDNLGVYDIFHNEIGEEFERAFYLEYSVIEGEYMIDGDRILGSLLKDEPNVLKIEFKNKEYMSVIHVERTDYEGLENSVSFLYKHLK